MDAYVRRYIHEHFLYRYVIVENGKAALAIETKIKSGAWSQGQPLLNPGRHPRISVIVGPAPTTRQKGG